MGCQYCRKREYENWIFPNVVRLIQSDWKCHGYPGVMSGLIDYDIWGLSPNTFQFPNFMYGPFQYDWFASEHNAKIHIKRLSHKKTRLHQK